MATELNINEVLNRFGSKFVADLVNDIRTKLIERKGSKGNFSSVVNTTGKLAESVRYEVTASTLTIYANDYIYYLEHGRKPGKTPPFSVIRKWVDDKGVFSSVENKDSLAWAITKSIAKKGTTIYQAGGSDLVSSIFTLDKVAQVEAEFGNLLVTELFTELNLAFAA